LPRPAFAHSAPVQETYYQPQYDQQGHYDQFNQYAQQDQFPPYAQEQYQNAPAQHQKQAYASQPWGRDDQAYDYPDHGAYDKDIYGTFRSTMTKLRGNGRTCMYGCIPVKKTPRYICLVGYLFYPRSPQFRILDIVPAGSKAYSITGFDQADPTKLNFKMTLNMTVAVFNQNSYHLKVDNMDLTIFIAANGTEINNAVPISASNFFGGAPLTHPRPWTTKDNYRQAVAKGQRGTITFPPGTNTTFMLQLAVDFTPTSLYDPALNEILQGTGWQLTLVCNYDYVNPQLKSSEWTRTMGIQYEAVNAIGLLKIIGFSPTV
ncbi:hypothetical protein HDU91_004062, partial [Kappamyces sp. JEL0680]